MNLRITILSFILILLPIKGFCAQGDSLQQGINLYQRNKFDEAVEFFNELLETGESTMDEDVLLEAYKYLGYSLFLSGRQKEAKSVFKKIISRKKDFQLDPLLVLPGIVACYKEALEEYNNPLRIVNREFKPSYFIPGGTRQFMTQQKKKGEVTFLWQALSLAASFYCYWRAESLLDKQHGLQEKDLSTYSRWTNRQRIFTISFILGYSYSVLDPNIR